MRRTFFNSALGIGAVLLAFALGAIFTPLETTITLRGPTASSQPTFALQTPYDGTVIEVLVEPQAEVEEGQLLVVLDTTIERAALETQRAIKSRIEDENAAINAILASIEHKRPAPEKYRKSPHYLQHERSALQGRALLENAQLLGRQVTALKLKTRHSEAQLNLISDRSLEQAELTRQGILRRSEEEQLSEQMLRIRGEIATDRAAVLDLQSEIARTIQQIELDRLALSYELSAQRQRNLAILDETELLIIEIADKIGRSKVYAPISGVVTSVPIAGEQMFAEQGTTLLTLLRSQETVEISTNSPDANTDEDRTPIFFEGYTNAEANILGILADHDAIDPLPEDIPVELEVSRQETAFTGYVLTPLVNAIKAVFQG